MSEDTSAVLERIRRIAAEGMRRAQAAVAPAGTAHADEPAPTLTATGDRPAEAEPERSAAPPRHWSEVDEGDDLRKPENAGNLRAAPGRTTLSLEAGELAARENACVRLRKKLADGRWHSALELVEVAGLRFGGRLFEIRRGLDGGPALDVEAEARERGARQVWFYRLGTPREQVSFPVIAPSAGGRLGG